MRFIVLSALLISIASAQLAFQYVDEQCAYYSMLCENDPTGQCLGGTYGVSLCMANFGVDPTVVTGVPNTDVAFAYAACAFIIANTNTTSLQSFEGDVVNDAPLGLVSLYQCDCEMSADCDWKYATGVIEPLIVCLQDPLCKTDWEAIVKDTTEEDNVAWTDQFGAGIAFPDLEQEDDKYCSVLFTMLAQANTKNLYLGTALFSFLMSNGDDIVDYCNDDMEKTIKGKVMTMVGIIGAVVFVVTLSGTCVFFRCRGTDKTSNNPMV